MVVLNVKNTMIERVLEIIAPHPCISCGKVGLILCVSCKYDIIHEPFGGCILCEWPQKSGICLEHGAPLEKAFVVSDRFGSLSQIIDALKLDYQHNEVNLSKSDVKTVGVIPPPLPAM